MASTNDNGTNTAELTSGIATRIAAGVTLVALISIIKPILIEIVASKILASNVKSTALFASSALAMLRVARILLFQMLILVALIATS